MATTTSRNFSSSCTTSALTRAQEIAADSFSAHVVPLGDGVWGIADDTEPGAPIVTVVRQGAHGIAIATATRLASQLGTGAPDWAPVDTALRQLAGDTHLAQDVAQSVFTALALLP